MLAFKMMITFYFMVSQQLYQFNNNKLLCKIALQ